jgi:hypothetical protein
VESERLVRDVVADRLEGDGYEVIGCPGPTAPDYTCVGTRGGRCPLEKGADVIVVDTELPGDDTPDAASGIELLSYYSGTGKPVVALRAGSDELRLFAGERIRPVAWPPGQEALIEAIEELAPTSDEGAIR